MQDHESFCKGAKIYRARYKDGRSGCRYRNEQNNLPQLSKGEYYLEWDIYFPPNARGLERIVTAHDSTGKVFARYYTDTHYGNPGCYGRLCHNGAFVRIKEDCE